MSQAVIAYIVKKVPDTFPVCAAVEMPLGAIPFAVVPHGQGMAVLALGDPRAIPVHHPLFIFPAGMPCDLPIGTKPGAFIGHAMIDGEAAFVFRANPWPEANVPGLSA